MRVDPKVRQKVSWVIARWKELARESRAVLLASLRVELVVIRTLCRLAEKETGGQRENHLQQAQLGMKLVGKLAARTDPAV